MSIAEYQIKINKKYPQETLEVAVYTTSKEKTVIKCCDCGAKYSFKRGSDALSKGKKFLCRKCGKQRSLQKKFEQSLRDRFHEPFILIGFVDTQKPCQMLCPICGTVAHVQHATSLRTRKHLCQKCHPFRNEDFLNTKKDFVHFIQSSESWTLAQDINNIHSQDKILCRCSNCGRLNEKTIYDYMRGIKCQCSRKNNIETLLLNEAQGEYQLLKTATTQEERIQLLHESCGYKYSVKARTFLDGWGRCPKCFQTHSKGERRIKKWLDAHEVSYEMEYPKSLNGHVLRFDFYLPQFDLYIEFQGKQHYESVAFFDERSSLKKRQTYDKIKRAYCGDRLLEIPYYDIDKIDDVLSQKVQRLSNIGVLDKSEEAKKKKI